MPNSKKLLAGASGYSFKEWKGTFYPEKAKPEEMLAFYSERLPTVEINNTFYQMPKVAVLENWARTTPESFKFAIKASRRITHMSRLKADSAADSVGFLYRNLAALGAKRGPVLYQLPPFLKKDLPRLSEFLAPAARRARRGVRVPQRHLVRRRRLRGAQERRRGALPFRARGQCTAASGRDCPVGLRAPAAGRRIPTRIFRTWAQRLAATGWGETYVYFMHEPTAPAYAQTLMKFAAGLRNDFEDAFHAPLAVARRRTAASCCNRWRTCRPSWE